MVDWERIASIIEEVIALGDDSAAEARLQSLCGDDAELLADCRAAYRGEKRRRIDPLLGRDFSDYRLVQRIGRGGMGVVYRAERHGRLRSGEQSPDAVAVKLLEKRDDSKGRELAKRFHDEIANTRTLNHPNIVRVYASGGSKAVDEHLWFAMELVDGHDLGAELQQQRRVLQGEQDVETLWPPFGSQAYVAAVVEHLAAVASALDVAHSHMPAIVHRDVKPKNILLRQNGSPVLADFGLAKVIGAQGLTETKAMLGTLPYLSPEQAQLEAIRVTGRSDIYSLGVVLFEALSLELPVEGANYKQLLTKITTGDLRSLDEANPKVPRDLVTICHKCLSWRPSDRYASAADLRADLLRFRRLDAIEARRPSMWRQLEGWVRKNPRRSQAAGVAVVVGGLMWGVMDHRATERRIDGARGAMQRALELGDWEGEEDVVLQAFEAMETPEARDHLPRLAAELKERSETELEALLQELDRPGSIPSSIQTVDYGSVQVPPRTAEVIRRAVRAARARVLHPEDATLEDAIEALEPVVRLDVAAGGRTARVFARERDPINGTHGPARLLGETPVDAQLPVGAYRFVFVNDDGFAELDREIGLAPQPIEARIRTATIGSFVRVEGGVLRLDEELQPACVHTELDGEVSVADLWVADSVVSNAEYITFIEQAGGQPPARWVDAAPDEDWRALPGLSDEGGRDHFLSLPVTGLSIESMQAYAEWAGCRLPTHFELEYVLRGPDDSPRPEPANVNGSEPDDIRPAERFRHYRESVLPARADGYEHGAYDLFHAFGNVYEATSTPPIVPQAGVLRTRDDDRIMLGASWALDQIEERYQRNVHGFSGVGDQPADFNLGFRLVRSVDPLGR